MKKTFLAVLLVAASAVCGDARDVRVLLNDGVERKGELAVTDTDAIFLKFKNGVTRKFFFSAITSVKDEETGKEILPDLLAEGKASASAEPAPAAQKAPEQQKAPAAVKPPPARKASDTYQPRSAQKALPDNVLGWMSARYDAKTMLGFKWEHPDKARLNYAFERNNYFSKAGLLAGSEERRGPAALLEIMPTASFYDSNAFSQTTDSYLEVRYAQTGAGMSWSAGYIKYSETRDDWIYSFTDTAGGYSYMDGDKFRKTEAGVIYASLLLATPSKPFAWYAYAGPALASYTYTESGTATMRSVVYFPYSSTTSIVNFDASKSGTAATWLGGFGFSLRAAGGFGLFGEYKYIAGSGKYLGGGSLGAGLSFGF